MANKSFSGARLSRARAMPDIPEELVKQFAAGAGSAFVGAGASIAAGLPSWAELVKPLRDGIGRNCPRGANFLDVAQFYENQFGRASLTEQIRNRLEGRVKQPSALHFAIVRLLRAGRIYTTNLDGLLEKAADEIGLPYRTIVNTDPQISFFNRDHLTIIKLHGDVKQPKSYVITAQDYESYFRKNPGLTRIIATEFQIGTVLFIGYSHTDIDLRMILRRITDENGLFSQLHYTVQLNPKEAVAKDFERRILNVIRIRSRRDIASSTNAVSAWLEQLQDKIGQFSRTTITEGFPGVGKTALAYDVGLACVSSHSARVKFDYAVWTQANKPDQKLWFEEILNAVALVLTGERMSSRATYGPDKYELLREKKVLIIINNYENIEDEKLTDWIRNLREPNKVIITTQRRQPADAEWCWRIPLEGLATKDAIDFARGHARQLGLTKFLQDRDIAGLAEIAGGNPQVIKLALGLVGGARISLPEVVEQLGGIPDRQIHDNLLEVLFAWSWTLLSEDAKRLLMFTTLFVGTSVVRLEALLEISGMKQNDFDRALDQLLEFKLLEPAYAGRFITHSMTRAFARRKLEDRRELRNRGRKACVAHFLKYVERNVKRKKPPVPYWNALVSEGMEKIDPEWSSVQAAISWASDDELVEFVMLLTHYMDSRFLNAERIEYMRRVLDTLSRSGRKTEEALLRIDGISWTLVETDRLKQALDEIVKGLKLAKKYARGQEKNDLMALGLAWKARVMVELDESANVQDLLDAAKAVPCRAWIKHRVNMAAGDVAMKQGPFPQAYHLAHRQYQNCARLVKTYGGEGHDYQIVPRLGFAHLGLGNLDQAERCFEELRQFGQITVGRMYAEYGLALVTQARGQLDAARELIEQLRARILNRSSSSVLLKLVDQALRPLSRTAVNRP